MPTPPISRAEAHRRIDAIEQALREGGTPMGVMSRPGTRSAARIAWDRLGLRQSVDRASVEKIEAVAGRQIDWSLSPDDRIASDAPPKPRFDPPSIPDADVPVEELIEKLERNYQRRAEHKAAKTWARFTLHDDGPYCLAVVGDPHLDDPGTNWALLRQHHKLMRRAHVHGVCLGDVVNNWAGRLQRLYAEQEVTRTQGWKLAQWFFSTVPWLVIVKGNHDLWSSSHGTGDPLDWMSRGGAMLEDWSAQFEVATPAGHAVRIWAAHDFKGTSIYNPLHGPMRAAKFSGGDADVYVAGHQHHWELFNGEDANKSSRPFWLARARGYKFLDSYADQHQFGSQKHGATIGIVVDPSREGPAALHCYADLAEAVEIMEWKRARWEAAACHDAKPDTTIPTGKKPPRTRAK
jgi:hypothetical protein